MNVPPMDRVALYASACPLSIGLLVAGTTWAEPSGSALTADGPSPVAAGATSRTRADEREADALLERAKAHFRAGEYRRSLPLVERALALSDSPRFLFNLGVLHHKLSECVPAREYFQRYLERDAAGAAREQTLAALRELNAHCPAEEPETQRAAAPMASPTATFRSAAPASISPSASALPREVALTLPGGAELPPPPPPKLSVAPPPTALVLLGLGAAAGVASVVTVALQNAAQSDIDALASRAAEEGLPWDVYEGERHASSADARLYRGLAIGLGAACTALVGAGATVWILDANQSSLETTGVGVGYASRF
jgi:hypothetical protein